MFSTPAVRVKRVEARATYFTLVQTGNRILALSARIWQAREKLQGFGAAKLWNFSRLVHVSAKSCQVHVRKITPSYGLYDAGEHSIPHFYSNSV
jgi:hypothetical protein